MEKNDSRSRHERDVYIVRIYRREGDDPHILVGVIEKVGVEGGRVFHSSDELISILKDPGF